MKISDYDYDLPDEKIAYDPPKTRGKSKLLVIDRHSGKIQDRAYSDVVDYLNEGDVLVLNDTKVIKARLIAKKENGAEREIVLLEKHGKNDNWHTHKVMYRRKIKNGDVLHVGASKIHVIEILGDGLAIVKSDADLLGVAERFGKVPLPPYIKRDTVKQDTFRYQTIWAKEQGSVAAPTASLNMTESALRKLKEKGVKIQYATLHVGLGTFMPIRTDDVEHHIMHKEYFELPKSTILAIREAKAQGKKVVALGTTITRTLEYCHKEIWNDTPQGLSGEADIFIYPGYEFKVIDGLLTNFHAPHSTVLMLASAFAGWENLKNAYEHAKANDYRFLSYGDSTLII